MISKIVIVCALLLVPRVIYAAIDDRCLNCICEIESRCQALPCKPDGDGDGDSCGYYQLKYVYWIDCGSPGGSFYACTINKSCSERCIHAYMNRYAKRCTGGRTPTCQDYARIHNGGPGGCMSPSTVRYWNRLAGCYHR